MQKTTVRTAVRKVLATASLASLGVSLPLLAQQPQAQLDEIVVTAQKREESLVDVPISIAVLGGDDIVVRGLSQIDDYIESVPNVTFLRQNAWAPDVTIRAVSANVGGRFDPIAVSVDGIPFGVSNTSTILNSRLLDLERVEVHRGPQGTGSGVNALGGAINYISAKPRFDGIASRVSLEASRYSTAALDGTLNLPLGDRVAARVSGFFDRSGGAVRNAGPGGGGSDYENYGGRVAIRLAPSDRTTIDAAVTYEDKNAGFDTARPLDRYFSESTRTSRIATLNGLGGDYFANDFLEGSGNDRGFVFSDLSLFTEQEFTTAMLGVTHELDQHEIALLVGRFDYRADRLLDPDNSEFPVQRIDSRREHETTSAELRIASSYEGSLNWIGGLSYVTDTATDDSERRTGDGVSTASYEFASRSFSLGGIDTRAAFGTLFWKPVDRLQVAAGVRLSRHETSSEEGFTTTPTTPVTFRERGTDDQVAYSVSLTYELTDRLNVYAQVAEGYRAGFDQIRAANLGLAGPKVAPELVRNHELGLKGRLFDDKLSVAVALFHMDYSDLQVADYAYVADEGYVYFDVNASEAYIRGFELELAARPLPGVELTAAVGYADSKIDELSYFGTVFNDIALPQARPWSVAVGAQYSRALGAYGDGFVRADYLWRDRTFEGPARAAADEINRYDVVNLSAGLDTGRWRLVAYVDNVLGETYWLSNGTGASLRGTIATYAPRSYGLRLIYRNGL